MAGTPEAQLRTLVGRMRKAEKQLDNARHAVRASILAALDEGVRVVDICAITGFTREYVRRLAEAEREAQREAASRG